MHVTDDALSLATAALQKGAGTYLARHASEIARAALEAPTSDSAARAVREMVAHTSVGRRNYEKWAEMARGAIK